jgi:hypothetical protein
VEEHVLLERACADSNPGDYSNYPSVLNLRSTRWTPGMTGLIGSTARVTQLHSTACWGAERLIGGGHADYCSSDYANGEGFGRGRATRCYRNVWY